MDALLQHDLDLIATIDLHTSRVVRAVDTTNWLDPSNVDDVEERVHTLSLIGRTVNAYCNIVLIEGDASEALSAHNSEYAAQLAAHNSAQPRKREPDEFYIAAILDAADKLESTPWLAKTLLTFRKYIARDADLDITQRDAAIQKSTQIINKMGE